MSGKRLPLLAFVLCAALGAGTGFLLNSRRQNLAAPEPPAEPPTAPERSAPEGLSAQEPPRLSPPAVQPQSPPSSLPGRNASDPSSTIVEFEVTRNGWAVAFGDVLLGKIEEGFKEKRGHTEIRPPQIWDRPTIPYLISPSLPDPARVERALLYYARNTPVRFVPYQGQRDALVFEPGEEHCNSYLGRTGGMQPIRLTPGCATQEIIHELMHALGFIHEQMRTDRDQYIEVLFDQILEPYRPQYAIAPEALMDPVRGTPFDFNSAMLYRSDVFAIRKGAVTLKARNGEAIEPAKDGLSEGDIFRLKRLYRQ